MAPCTGRRIPIHYATRCSHGIKIFYSYSNFFFPLATLVGLQDLISPTRDRTWAPCNGSGESNH